MPWTALGPAEWAAEQFGQVDLGDRRLNRRVVAVAASMASDPGGSIPRQSKRWAQAKGAYRLFDHPRVTFDSVSRPHWQETRRQCQQQQAPGGVVLLIQDTTWLNYSAHPGKAGMGWHGPGVTGGSGLFLHSVLAVRPRTDEEDDDAGDAGAAAVIGVAWATVWARDGQPVGSDPQRRSRRRRSDDRESLRWTTAVKEIGGPAVASPSSSPSPSPRWLHVGDRESDIFDLYEQSQARAGVGFVVRLSKDRNASAGHDTPDTVTLARRHASSIKAVCRAMPLLGGRHLWVRPRADRPGRWAKLSIAAGPVTLWSPQLDRTGRALRCWAVRVWEADPPAGHEPVEWILLTSEPVDDLADAVRVVGYYALRWLIEEYHQCLKSGCRVEARQLETADRLEPLIGMSCAVAARLLQLKNDARLTPDRPATACVPTALVETLSKLTQLDARTLTVRRFVHEVAKLGGFLGRKGDGEPGWRTVWQGWHQLELIHRGYRLARGP
jgi:hypothetical protein